MGVSVGVGVSVGTGVSVGVSVGTGVSVGVSVGVGVLVGVFVRVGVLVGVGVNGTNPASHVKSVVPAGTTIAPVCPVAGFASLSTLSFTPTFGVVKV